MGPIDFGLDFKVMVDSFSSLNKDYTKFVTTKWGFS